VHLLFCSLFVLKLNLLGRHFAKSSQKEMGVHFFNLLHVEIGHDFMKFYKLSQNNILITFDGNGLGFVQFCDY